VKIAKVTIGAAEKAVGKEELEECVEYEESERLSVRSKAP
jgi:ATP-dependent DNA helicase RecQ